MSIKSPLLACKTRIATRKEPRIWKFLAFTAFIILLENVTEIDTLYASEKSNVSLNLSAAKETKVGDEIIKEASHEDSKKESFLVRIGNMRSMEGFFAALSLIIGTELGDKTFFIAAIMSMRHSRVTIFISAMSALILMTFLSVGLGYTSNFIPQTLTHFLSVILFFGFGLKMIYDGYTMTEEEAKEEFEEVNKKISKRESLKTVDIEYSLVSNGKQTTEDTETGVLKTIKSASIATRFKRWTLLYISLTFVETFAMTFVAEWGDRSQIATIALAANHEMISVTIGAIVGHCMCTGLAVIGGRLIAQRISVRTVTIIGGFIFIFFAVLALVMQMHQHSNTTVSKT
ncbi:Transmembrane protein 165-like protein [Leptotrombidium deliense]|uniref:GDT1 family protein n=1 Tax=Leptotrombidium deliense TaxID=299467 RepID=A0A443SLA3_9ACAR|nr:Transmembrane protein 165-like protein [Leptotrombidium deliense]